MSDPSFISFTKNQVKFYLCSFILVFFFLLYHMHFPVMSSFEVDFLSLELESNHTSWIYFILMVIATDNLIYARYSALNICLI